MKVGVIGGGFKPPHKGHYELAKQALTQVPDLDKMIIFVGKNVRDGIDQSQAVAIWNLYKDSLGSKVEIIPASKPPIGHVYSYASKNPEDQVHWFLGARDEEDEADIADRTSYLEKNREKYPNLNVEVVKSTGTDVSGTAARKALRAGDKESFFQALPDIVDKDKVYDIVKTPETQMADAIDELFTNFMYEERVDFKRLESILDDMFEDLDIDINFTTHFRERVIERGLTEEDIIELMQKIHDKYPDELDFLGAGENRVFTHLSKLVDIAAVNKGYGEDYLKDLVLKTAYKRSSTKEPEFRTNASSPKLAVAEITKGTPVAPIAVLPSKERQRLQNYTEYLQRLMPPEFDVEYRQDHIKVSLPYFDKNKNHKQDWTPHQTQLPEQAQEEKFDFTPHIASILEYCMSKEMKVVPIPEVKVRHDEENAANLFGRTGYYDPQNQEIVLYVTGRHPKDVLRSFCHELIHHMQNLEGRDLTFYTTDVHADENLKAIEQEAHAKGSFLFRDWENSNKEQQPVDEKKSLTEKRGKLNPISNRISSIVFNILKQTHAKGKTLDHTLMVGPYEDADITEGDLEFDLRIILRKGEYNYTGGANSGEDFGAGDEDPYIEVVITLPEDFNDWEELSMHLKDLLRHEIEHLKQGGINVRPGGWMEDDAVIRKLIGMEAVPEKEYYKLAKEVDAMIQGIWFQAKKSRRPLIDVAKEYLESQKVSLKDQEEILSLWSKRLPALGVPKDQRF